jgi:cell shape-determining protein MreC
MLGAKNQSELRSQIELLKQQVAELERALSRRDPVREELQANRLLFETLLKNTPAAVAMFDTEMRYLA